MLSLLVVIVLIILDDWLATPSCKSVLNIDLDEPIGDHPEDLKVMVVANLLLLGSEASFVNIFFRDQYISKSFKVTPFLSGPCVNLFNFFSGVENLIYLINWLK